MKYASDYRADARAALRGRWPIAILTGFLASLLGGSIGAGGGGGGGSSASASSGDTLADYLTQSVSRETLYTISALASVLLIIIVGYCLVLLAVGGAAALGYARFNLNLIDGGEAKVGDLVSQFHRLGAGFLMRLLTGIYTFLWSMLFVIPGIIKMYSYAMTPYILYEHPEMSANEAITESRRIMDGNKWRLFCLELSFIGWDLLCALPMIISAASAGVMIGMGASPAAAIVLLLLCLPLSAGYLILNPYREAAYAAFYRDISGTSASDDGPEEAE